MPDFSSLFDGIKTDVVQLAKDTLGSYATQAGTDATQFLETVKADLLRYTEELANGQIDKDMFIYLLNTDKVLGLMKLQTEIGMGKVAADKFTAGVKKIVIDTLVKVVDILL